MDKHHWIELFHFHLVGQKKSVDFLGETVVEHKKHINCFVLLHVFLLKELSLDYLAKESKHKMQSFG